jgi:hypothetical protein
VDDIRTLAACEEHEGIRARRQLQETDIRQQHYTTRAVDAWLTELPRPSTLDRLHGLQLHSDIGQLTPLL